MSQHNENIFRGARALCARARVIYMVVAAVLLSLTVSVISATIFTSSAFADEASTIESSIQTASLDDALLVAQSNGAGDFVVASDDQAIPGAEGEDFSTSLTVFASLEMTGEGAMFVWDK